MDTLYVNNVLFPGRLCFKTCSRGQDRLKVKRHTLSVSTYNKGLDNLMKGSSPKVD